MFKFLKEKISEAVKKISKGIDEKGKEEVTKIEELRTLEDIQKEEVKKEFGKKIDERPIKIKEEQKKSFFTRVKERVAHKEEPAEVKKVEEPRTLEEIKTPEIEEIKEEFKQSILEKVTEKITTKKIDENQFNDMFFELEVTLLENSVAVEVIEKIKEDLKMDIVNVPIKRGQIEEVIQNGLKESISELFDVPTFDLIDKVKTKKPFVIVFLGTNGSGKTTTIAKVANLLKKNGLNCVIAAADTFRSAAIEQLEEHANKLGIKLIKHEYKSDPAAVCFDAVKHAQAKNVDVVLIDTAGRLHSNEDLMNEMKKIVRVAQPDLKIFVGEAIVGNDATLQAQKFNEAVGIDGIILSKADVDEKGGASISVSYVAQKPILYLGVGQGYEDLKKFDRNEILSNLGL